MKLEMSKKPKGATIIAGFPGFGLVGSIAAEFLVSHLQTEKIGRILLTEMPAMVAIHQKRVIDTISLYYSKKENILLVHGIASLKGMEWEIAERISKLASSLKAKEIIALEGVGAGANANERTFYHATLAKAISALEKDGSKPLEEGIIIGITAALLSTAKVPLTCMFAETASELPDSKAAASLIKSLDHYLGLNVDYKPLLVQAQKFEEKIKNLLASGQKMQEMSEKKSMSYVG